MNTSYISIIEFLHYESLIAAYVHEISPSLLGFYAKTASSFDLFIQMSFILKFIRHEYCSYGSGPSSEISFNRSSASSFNFLVSSSEESLSCSLSYSFSSSCPTYLRLYLFLLDGISSLISVDSGMEIGIPIGIWNWLLSSVGGGILQTEIDSLSKIPPIMPTLIIPS